MVFPILFLFYQFFVTSKHVVEKQVYETGQESMSRLAQQMDETITQLLKYSKLFVADSEVQEFLQLDNHWDNDYEVYQRMVRVQKKLLSARDVLIDNRSYIALLDLRGNIYSTWYLPNSHEEYDILRKEDWFQKTIILNGLPYWNMPYKRVINTGDSLIEETMLTMSRLLKSDNGERQIGLLFIGIPVDIFMRREDPSDRSNSTLHTSRMILNEKGELVWEDRVISGLNHEGLFAHLKNSRQTYFTWKIDGEEYLVNSSSLPQLGWQLIQLNSRDDLLSPLSKSRNLLMSGMIVFIVTFIFVSFWLMLRFTKPISSLLKSMNRVGKGAFEPVEVPKGRDEIATLSRNFNRMVERLQNMIVHLKEEQIRREKAKFQALQAQINPHFLFNTLNSIKWMATLSGAQHVSEMLIKLGRLLQLSMSHDRELVTLGEELEYIHLYMDLQKIRFHDNISVEINIPEALLECNILKFTLQPLIENSIVHGNRFPLIIRICAFEQSGVLIIEVKDNGVGLTEEQLVKLHRNLEPNTMGYNGIGLFNVNDRVRMHFGTVFGLELYSSYQKGMRVRITQPLTKGE
jgi:sensor histidine kinase YesM